ncbi:hypothetical protein TPHV1_170032 [Treponema phagedenis]|uniref:Uncharacterized protein n=1 Tax=Treponema phagedenis TaxID=162 RepID=A0A0B7GXC9_TREPH|nr:hypothetical protein TPHV1_170032 [Treponema phagedenis]
MLNTILNANLITPKIMPKTKPPTPKQLHKIKKINTLIIVWLLVKFLYTISVNFF